MKIKVSLPNWKAHAVTKVQTSWELECDWWKLDKGDFVLEYHFNGMNHRVTSIDAGRFEVIEV